MLSVFPDTSFLFALYQARTQSAAAARIFAALTEPLPVTVLLLFEFENAARVAAWLNTQEKRKGLPPQMVQTILARLDSDLDDGVLDIVPCDFGAIISLARKMSNARTWRGGHRPFDLLHVATAKYLNARRFLSFNVVQRRLAVAEGLKVAP
jgi:predicted nucleic acid-binding protein